MQGFLRYKGDETSVTAQIILALPHLTVAVLQALFYLFYSAIPIYGLINYRVVERIFGENTKEIPPTEIDDPNSWGEYFKRSSILIIINYAIVWAILVGLQFSSLRRFSQKKRFGMALNTQQEQRKVFISCTLWLLSFFFTVLCLPSIFGLLRLSSGYAANVQADPTQRVSCRNYFVHAFQSAAMGYVDLVVKILEVCVLIMVRLSQAIMFVLPWRKGVLEKMIKEVTDQEEIDGKDRMFLKAGIVIYQALQTLLDVPFLLISVLVFFIAPWRSTYFCNRFKTTEASGWKFMIMKEIFDSVVDLPFVLMFIVICCSIFMAFKLKNRLLKR